ncbi:hypothetical protein APR41_08015 [Salegentibacter salinarum]|uniref:Sulfotransferase domain-containing protein n=1 Tax=Salegentibacter salinarum TaxID=447422 RepID=A0A2N0TPT6_9FLAO|nr:sulfotransferase [Salegentibacter salinarum]PKD16742.1 hypothetical protein APR41_08015 [Salegentibacter salinarum]SKB59790.1 hypothetical protein SAMN05660903_01589 [Salegentibacter salinarum]
MNKYTVYRFLSRSSFIIYIYRKYLKIKKKIVLKTLKPQYNSKVFCIGFQKTGTTTLGKSLEILGYNHSSFDHTLYLKHYKKNRNISKIIDYTSKFDSFDDMPWSKTDLIPILDYTFPGSKFIYLTRDEESWKKSMKNWGYKKFGKHLDVEALYKEYLKHNEFVLSYFKDRIGEDLIVLNIGDKKGFKKLANFLSRKTHLESFPHYNKTSDIRIKI